jgi:Flp pilus assembly protein TadB
VKPTVQDYQNYHDVCVDKLAQLEKKGRRSLREAIAATVGAAILIAAMGFLLYGVKGAIALVAIAGTVLWFATRAYERGLKDGQELERNSRTVDSEWGL